MPAGVLPFHLFSSSRQEILKRHVPLEQTARCSSPVTEKEVGVEAEEEEDMYHLKRLHLALPPVAEKEEEEEKKKGRYERDSYTNCYYDIGEFIYVDGGNFSSLTLPATTKPLDATTVLVAFRTEDPVLKILQPGVGKWVEHRCGWTFHDVCAFEGRLYAVTTDGKIVEVKLAGDGGVVVELLESEKYEDEEQAWSIGRVVHHMFDVFTDTGSRVLQVSADEWGISKVKVRA